MYMEKSHKCVSSRCGFTLIELLVVVAIVALLATIMVPAMYHAEELARRTKCLKNVQGIAQACGAYMNTSNLHRGSNKGNPMPTRDPAPTSANWHNATAGNPSALWMLVAYKFVGRESFLCPSAEVYRDFREPAANDTSFDSDTLSYSYLSQVSFTDGNTGVANITVTSSFSTGLKAPQLAIIADANPRCRVGTAGLESAYTGANSLNHNMEGQNVAFFDGHAEWFSTSKIPGTKPRKNSAALDDIYQSCDTSADSKGERGAINDAFLIP